MFENRDFLSPSSVFCMMLLGSLFMCVISSSDYSFELGLKVFNVLLCGTLIFTVISLLHYVSHKRTNIFPIDPSCFAKVFNPIELSKTVLFAFLIIELVVSYFAIKYIIDIATASTGGFSSLSIAIGIYDNLQKFDLQGLQDLHVNRHPIYSMGWPLLTSVSYISIYVICHNLILCKKKESVLTTIVAVYFALTFLSGGRTYAFRVITAFVTYFYYFSNAKLGFHKRQLSFILKIILVAIGVVAFFTLMRQVLGRNMSDYKWYQTMFSYFGAPIVNLDYYLEQCIYPTSKLFGQESLFGIYNFIGNRFNIGEYIYSLDLPFVYCTGRNTGNVYTMFYQFVHDFGYWGIVPLVTFMAYVYNKLYRKSYVSIKKKNTVSISLFIYGYLINDLIMSFFSNKFYETTVTVGFARFMVWTFIIWNIVIEKRIEFRELRIRIKRN